MNGHANCIYGICCPPDSDAQRAALREEFEKAFAARDLADPERREIAAFYAGLATRFVLDNFDLAPKGSLQPFKDEIARLAREPRDKSDGKV